MYGKILFFLFLLVYFMLFVHIPMAVSEFLCFCLAIACYYYYKWPELNNTIYSPLNFNRVPCKNFKQDSENCSQTQAEVPNLMTRQLQDQRVFTYLLCCPKVILQLSSNHKSDKEPIRNMYLALLLIKVLVSFGSVMFLFCVTSSCLQHNHDGAGE